MNTNLVGNKFWDNTDPSGNGGQYFHKSDLRREFLAAFNEWAEPYCTKGTKWVAEQLGLFGTSSGLKLIIKNGSIRKSVNMSISALVKKFGEETGIPVFTSGAKVFSNTYSLYREEKLLSTKRDFYSTKVLDAYEELFGKPLYVKTDKILGKLSEFLEDYKDEEFISVRNYNYVGSIFSVHPDLVRQALREIGEDFDVVKVEGEDITIQEDDYELVKKLDYKCKLLYDSRRDN